MQKKLGVVITDGVGYRNYILTDFITESKKYFDEVIIFSCLPKFAYEDLNLNCKIVELEVFKENFITWFFRKSKEVAHLKLYKKNNFGITDNLNANKSKSKTVRGFATRLVFILTSLFNSESFIKIVNKLQQLSFANNKITKEYKDLLKSHNLSLLLFTHQRPPFIAPLIFTAEQLKIKTSAFVFSWDNLASKGRMSGYFDYYLVWSDLMKQDMLHFYPKTKNESIIVVGTPQFEPYVLDRYKTSKKDFLSKFNLDINKKTICFSCGDISTSKNDELYIEIMANAINNNKLEDVNFLVRTSPAEDSIRFSSLVEKFPFIKWNFPKWILTRKGHQEEWSQRIPTIEDIQDLRAIVEFSDLNINVVSTMTLDFMTFDKPVIYPVFGNGVNGLYDDRRFLKFTHLEIVKNSNAVYIVYNEEELVNAICEALNNPTSKLDFQRELLKIEIGKPLVGTSDRIAEVLFKITD